MRLESQGLSLWYATPDAPAPGDGVTAGLGVLVTVGMSPPDASNRIDVHYRINGDTIGSAPARWFRNDVAQDVQYFTVRIPALRERDHVEYWVTASCSGRYVPPREHEDMGIVAFEVGRSGTGDQTTIGATLVPSRPSSIQPQTLTGSVGHLRQCRSPEPAIAPARRRGANAQLLADGRGLLPSRGRRAGFRKSRGSGRAAHL